MSGLYGDLPEPTNHLDREPPAARRCSTRCTRGTKSIPIDAALPETFQDDDGRHLEAIATGGEANFLNRYDT